MTACVTSGFPYHAELSPSRTRFALSFYAGAVSIHEMPPATAVAMVTLDPRGGAPAVAWSADGQKLCASNEKSGIWLIAPGAADGASREIGERGCGARGLAWSSAGGIIAASSGKHISLWDEGGALRASLKAPWNVLGFSADASLLAVGDNHGARVLDVAELLASCAPRQRRARG